MKFKMFDVVILLAICIPSAAQVPAIWSVPYSGQEQLPSGILLNAGPAELAIWGRGADSACFQTAPALIYLDTSGLILGDTLFDINYCATEIPVVAIENEDVGGVYFATKNNVITPQDSSFIYYANLSLNLQGSIYAGEQVTSNILSYGGTCYYSSDYTLGGMAVNKFRTIGNSSVFNSVTLPYFPSAPHTLLASSGMVFELGTRSGVDDTAFVCQVYDTTGVYINTFSFDADAALDETMMHASLCNGQIFHVSYRPSVSKTFVASSSMTGATNWLDTIYHTYRGGCSDTINDVGYVLCTTGPAVLTIFSYDLVSGLLIDSVMIDSVASSCTMRSGPLGGVYFMYSKQLSNEIFLDQYDFALNLILRGSTIHPTCISNCTAVDFALDSIGHAYTVSNCNSCVDNILISKFSPSLLSISQVNEELHLFSLYPSPANSEVTLILSCVNCYSTEITMRDILGNIVSKDRFAGTNYRLATNEYASGVYFVDVMSDSGERSTQKLIIQH